MSGSKKILYITGMLVFVTIAVSVVLFWARFIPAAIYFESFSTEVRVQPSGLLPQFEEVVLGAERTLEPYRLVPYLMDLAGTFHKFYTENRVITEDESLTRARLMLVESVQSVLRSGLGLLGVSAPLKM